jgi:excisionase family DNA binding protein
MSHELYSVEAVAERLGLHVKTVRAYVRGGRLKATKVGKAYRITHQALADFVGEPALPVARARSIDVSSVVTVDDADRTLHDRLVTALTASVNGRQHAAPVRIDAVYDEARSRLKLILSGDAAVTAGLLEMVSLIAGDRR